MPRLLSQTRARATTLACAAIFAAAASIATATPAAAQTGPLTAGHQQFLLNGKPFQIISGSMHYARVPREYWRDRMEKAKAMGLNTITTYVFWNYHEPTRGHFDFSGNRDLAAYLQTARDVGLHIILRPGPYVCAEWEFGGYPGWLFADTSIVVRSTDPKFTQPAEQWLDTLGKVVAPFFASHGGPVIAVQVENEYGSFDSDTNYLRWQVNALKHAGFNDVYFFTADGPGQLPHGTLPDVPAVVNLGPGDAAQGFARLSAFRPDGPLMIGEYWAGWFDQWGHAHNTTNAQQEADELRWILSHGYSVNLYMWHGGTTPGFLNGANSNGRDYNPQTSSYDYDAALDESGRPSRKYAMFRDVIASVTGATLPPVPASAPTAVVPTFAMHRLAGFSDLLPAPVRVEQPRNMETFGQSYGDILYRTHIARATSGDLVIRDVHDYAQVYVNGQRKATLDRRLGENTVALDVPANATLDILVENSGRVNFAKPLRHEEKGITHSVSLAGQELTGWDVYPNGLTWLSGDGGTGGTCTADPRPCLQADRAHGASAISPALNGPAYYAGTFTVDSTRDTFLDLRGWGKGTVWVNGHQLGRFWGIGPEQTLYVPGPWLHQGRNDVVVYDLVVPDHLTLQGLDHPILDDLHPMESLWYSTGGDSSTMHFVEHASQIDIVSPQVFQLSANGHITGHIDPRVIAAAHGHHVKLVPLVMNPGFDQAMFHHVLTDSSAWRNAMRALANLCRSQHLDGIQFDLENIHVRDRNRFTAFAREATDSVHRAGCTLSAAVVPRLSEDPGTNRYDRWIYDNWRGAYDYKALADTLDFISYMTYAEHTGGSTPGPVAGYPWMEACLRYVLSLGVPPEKISLGIPSYSDWWFPTYDEKAQARVTGHDISLRQADSLLAAHHATVTWDSTQHAERAEWSQQGVFRYLWAENARAFTDKLALVTKYHLRGYSVWVLGTEDPALWPALSGSAPR